MLVFNSFRVYSRSWHVNGSIKETGIVPGPPASHDNPVVPAMPYRALGAGCLGAWVPLCHAACGMQHAALTILRSTATMLLCIECVLQYTYWIHAPLPVEQEYLQSPGPPVAWYTCRCIEYTVVPVHVYTRVVHVYRYLGSVHIFIY